MAFLGHCGRVTTIRVWGNCFAFNEKNFLYQKIRHGRQGQSSECHGAFSNAGSETRHVSARKDHVDR